MRAVGVVAVMAVAVASCGGGEKADRAATTTSTLATTTTVVRTASSSTTSTSKPTTTTTAPEPVELTLEAQRVPGGPDSGPTITITGSANVPDGARVDWEINLTGCEALNCIKQGGVKVAGGRYRKVVKLPWTILAAGSPATVWVAFQPISQPPAVMKAYGEVGQRLQGAQVVESGSIRRAELEVLVPDESGL